MSGICSTLPPTSQAMAAANEAKIAAREATAAANELKALLEEYINEIDTLIGG